MRTVSCVVLTLADAVDPVPPIVTMLWWRRLAQVAATGISGVSAAEVSLHDTSHNHHQSMVPVATE